MPPIAKIIVDILKDPLKYDFGQFSSKEIGELLFGIAVIGVAVKLIEKSVTAFSTGFFTGFLTLIGSVLFFVVAVYYLSEFKETRLSAIKSIKKMKKALKCLK